MKNLCRLLLLLALIVPIVPAVAKATEPRFKVGDWFECEMEFGQNAPVFHNHWANNDSVAQPQVYVVVKFVLRENGPDSLEAWNYKIVRYRKIRGIEPKEKNSYRWNAHCADTWYPDYYAENFDSLRHGLVGSIAAYRNYIKKLTTRFDPKVLYPNWGAPSIFPILRSDGSYESGELFGGGSVSSILFPLFTLINFSENPSNNGAYKSKLYKVNYANEDSASFNIGSTNKYTAYLLPNGLAYAFKDKYNQKVLAITNASFALPNKAVVTINDRRSKSPEPKKYFSNVDISFGNTAHVISQKVKLDNSLTNYTFELKCGVEMNISCSNLWQSIFVEPGDHIQLTIQDDKNNPVLISGSTQNKDYYKFKDATISQIDASKLLAECKAYLALENKMQTTFRKVNSSITTAGYQRDIVDFYYLKSFHYRKLFGVDNDYTVFGMGNIARQNKMKEVGAPHRSDFKFKYYNTVANYSHFSLYAQLNSVLTGAILPNRKVYYDEFLTNCGDTLMTKNLSAKIKGVESVQVGMTLPFSKLLTEHSQEVNILPKKGSLGLLFLYVIPKDLKSLGKEFLSTLPDNVQFVSCEINRDQQIKSEGKIHQTSLALADSLQLHGHPDISNTLGNLLYAPTEALLLLYDHKGNIIYNAPYNGNNMLNAAEIRLAILRAKNKPMSKSTTTMLLIVVAVACTLLLAYGVYRIRMAQLTKKNAREKVIQELKLKSVQSQLNPHFLFNALNSIQVLVKSGESLQADKYLVGFSELLRNVLQNADKRLVPLSDELKMVNRYCELEKLRLDFDCELVTDTQTNLDLIEVPYMLLQPIIENAIKHGVAKANDRGKLKVEIKESNAELLISVTDNGPGFDDVPLDVLKEKGRGLKLSLEKLQSIYADDAMFLFEPANPGTTVYIKLKIG